MSFFEGVVGRVVGFVVNKPVRWEHYEVLRCRCGVRCGLGQRMKECKCAVRVGWVWKDLHSGARCMSVHGNIAGVHGKQGEFGDLAHAIFGSETMLAYRPKPLVGRISRGGDVGDRLGKRDRGILEMCEMALMKGRPLGRYFGSNAGHPAAQGYRDGGLGCQGWRTANTVDETGRIGSG